VIWDAFAGECIAKGVRLVTPPSGAID